MAHSSLPSAPLPEASGRRDGFTVERQRRFLEALAATGSISEAAQMVGVARQTLYRHRNGPNGEAFRLAWDRAQQCTGAMLGDVAIERALNGVEEPVFWKGEQVGTRRRYNDKLLMFMLRARTPFAFAPLPDIRGFTDGETHALPGLDAMIQRIEAQAFTPIKGPPAISPL